MLSPFLRKISPILIFIGLVFSSLFQVQPALAASTITVGSKPSAIIADNSGNIFVSNYGDGTISKIDPQGQTTVYANLSSVSGKATALAIDSSGMLYASVYSGQIYKVAADGSLTEFAKAGRKPVALVFDKNGNLYSANNLDSTVSKITSAGAVTKYATVGGQPDGLVFDSNGNLYSVNSLDNTVSKITSAGVVSTFATVGNIPMGITADSAGNLYVVNSDDNTISKVSSSGVVTTLATVGRKPMSIAIDSDGNLYTSNYTDGTVSKVTSAGQVSTYAITGSGPIDIAVNSSKTLVTSNYLSKSITVIKTLDVRAAAPKNLATARPTSTTVDLAWDSVDGSSEYYLEAITDSGTTLTTSARTSSSSGSFTLGGLCSKKAYQLKVYSVNANGLGTASTPATITMPTGVPGAPESLLLTAVTGTSVGLAWDPPSCDGGAAVTDYRISYSYDGGASWSNFSHTASTNTEITATGLVLGRNYIFKVAAINSSGVGIYSSYAYASTSTTQATYTVGSSPSTMVLDNAGNLFVANSGESSITKITKQGVVSNFASAGDNPTAMVFDTAGNLYVANSGSDNISKITPAGVSTIFASVDDSPSSLVFDSAGNLYSSNSLAATISKISPAGVVSNFATLPSNSYDLSIDSQGNIYSANGNNFSMYKITTQGEVSVFARLTVAAKRLTTDAAGNFYVYSVADKTIQKVTSSGVFSDFITLDDPITDLFIDKKQNFYIANNSYGSVSRIDSNGYLTAIAIFDNTVNRIVADSSGYLYSSFLENSVSKNYLGVVASAPRNLSSSSLTSTSVNLSWTAPESDGGSALLDYKVEQSLDSGATWAVMNRAQSTTASFAVSGLSPGKSYQFRIYAINGPGSSVASNTLTVSTPAIVPTAPKNLSASGITSAGLLLSWQAPDNDGGAAVTDYKIEQSGDNGSSWSTVTHAVSNATSLQINNLSAAKAYKFRVSAINTAGTSPASSIFSVTTSATYPGVARLLQINQATSTSLQLSWLAPLSDGGSSIIDYQIELSSDGGSTWTVLDDPATASTSYQVTNLTPATSFQLRVTAINSIGSGSASLAVTGTTLATVPNKPTALTTSQITYNSLQLSWLAPEYNGGSAVADYKIEISQDAGQNWTLIRESTSTTTTFSVTGLSPVSNYLFRVTAVNRIGSSAVSDSASATTLATTPGLPKLLTAVDVKADSLKLTWLDPDSDGGSDILDYRVEMKQGTSWVEISDGVSTLTELAVTGLDPLTSYSFRVTAINGIGSGPTSSVFTISTIASKAPSASTSITFTNIKSTSVSINWAPVVAEVPVTNYTVDYSVNGVSWTSVSKKVSLTTSISISSLKPATQYTVRVSAINSEGKGQYAYNTFTTSSVAPNPPTALVASAITGNSFNLAWNAPANNGGSQITNYIIEINGGQYSWDRVAHDPSNQTNIAITNLAPGVQYVVRVKAVNGIGSSAISKSLNVKTAAVLPSTPTGLTVKKVTKNSAIISWNPANSGGSAITDYILEYSTDSGKTWTKVSRSPSTATNLTLKSLKSKTRYLMRVSAKTLAGTSQPSASASLTTQ